MPDAPKFDATIETINVYMQAKSVSHIHKLGKHGAAQMTTAENHSKYLVSLMSMQTVLDTSELSPCRSAGDQRPTRIEHAASLQTPQSSVPSFFPVPPDGPWYQIPTQPRTDK